MAIELDQRLRDELFHLIEELRTFQVKASWVKPENLHITLKFLGDVKEEKIEKIKKVLQDIANSCATFKVKIKGTGTFPERRTPRVIWAGIEDSPELSSLQERIEKALSRLGFKQEERGFKGHITLARIKEPEGTQRLTDYLSRFREKEFGQMDVKEFVLMKSELRPDGARYERLAIFSL